MQETERLGTPRHCTEMVGFYKAKLAHAAMVCVDANRIATFEGSWVLEMTPLTPDKGSSQKKRGTLRSDRSFAVSELWCRTEPKLSGEIQALQSNH